VADLEDVARRLAALEERVEQEAGLRASLDRDHSALELALRSQGMLLQALAVTQSEHGVKLDRLDGKVDALHARIGEVAGMSREILAALDRLTGQA
jgi:peptidoglycan hydrolase CwlO-like protein